MVSDDLKCRRFLKSSVEKILIPKFILNGFDVFPLSEEDKKSEMKYRVPFGCLKKDIGNGVVIVEILFYRGSKQFVIDFAVAPKVNIKLPNGKCLRADEIHVTALPDRYCLYSNRFLSIPFGYGLFSSKNEETAVRLVTKVANLYCEIDEFLSSGKIGKHMKKEISFVGDKIVFCDRNDLPKGVE